MPIRIACPKCSAKLSVSSKMAGRKGKCPKCAALFRVPQPKPKPASRQVSDGTSEKLSSATGAQRTDKRKAPSRSPGESAAKFGKSKAATSPRQETNSKRTSAVQATSAAVSAKQSKPPQRLANDPRATAKPTAKKSGAKKSAAKRSAVPPARNPKYRQQLLAGFSKPIKPVRKSIFYVFALLMVTLLMLILPLLYLTFVAGVGFGTYWHVMNNQWLLEAGYGRTRAFFVMAYVAVPIVGAIATVFMLKPLVARPAKQPRTRSLTRKGEPLLFEFVDHVCEAVGSPRPTRIDVDCQMNASASFRRGFLSMFGSDLVLTIGMPLVAGPIDFAAVHRSAGP